MDLNIYEVIKGPWITAKAYTLNQALKQLVLEVHVHANKPMIMEALKKLFNVETDNVCIVVVKGKRRRAGRHAVVGKRRKKAIVTLKGDQSVDLSGWAPSVVEATAESASSSTSTPQE